MTTETALVTGATGFLGRTLCRSLVNKGFVVRGACRTGETPLAVPDVTTLVMDLRAEVNWDDLLEGVDVVYHMAWTSTPSSAAANPASDLQDNVASTVRLLEAARRRQGLRFVFPSSGGTVYGRAECEPIPERHPTRPISPYGVAKLAAERYVDSYRALHGLDTVTLRIANPYGVHQDPAKGLGAVIHFARAAISGRSIVIFGDGRVIRDYVHVDDVVAALVTAGKARGVGGEINIGSGKGRSLLDLVAALEKILGKSLQVEHRESRAFDVPVNVLDVSLAREKLGWSPMTRFEDGLRALVMELERGAPA